MSEIKRVVMDSVEVPGLNANGSNLAPSMYDALVAMLKQNYAVSLFGMADVHEVHIFHSEQAIRDFFNGRARNV